MSYVGYSTVGSFSYFFEILTYSRNGIFTYTTASPAKSYVLVTDTVLPELPESCIVHVQQDITKEII